MRQERWAGVICAFVLFIVVFVYQKAGLPAATCARAEPEPELLLFMLPGFIAGFLSLRGDLIRPLIGIALALPFCFLIMHLWLTPQRPPVQEVAWLFSGAFWCAIGVLCALCVRSLRYRQRRRCRH